MAQRRAKNLENQIQFLLQSFSWGDIEEQVDDQVRELSDLLNEVCPCSGLLTYVQLQQCISSMGQSDEAQEHKETYYHLSTSFSNLQAKLDDERKRAKLLKGRRYIRVSTYPLT